MSSPIVLVGAGGHAKSVLEAIGPGRIVAGYVDMAESALNLPYLGNDECFISENKSEGYELLLTVVAGKSCSLKLRERLIELYKDFGFAKIIAPTAYLSDDASIGDGTVLMHKSFVNADTRIGRHCVLNTASIVEHDCIIGDNVFIGPGAVVCGGVTIGNNVYIGANSTLRPGIKIADNVVVGLGGAVIEDIDSPGTYVGVPVKRLNK